MEKFWQRCGKWVKKKHWLLLHFLVIWITQTFVKAPHMMVIKCSYTDVDLGCGDLKLFDSKFYGPLRGRSGHT